MDKYIPWPIRQRYSLHKLDLDLGTIQIKEEVIRTYKQAENVKSEHREEKKNQFQNLGAKSEASFY